MAIMKTKPFKFQVTWLMDSEDMMITDKSLKTVVTLILALILELSAAAQTTSWLICQ